MKCAVIYSSKTGNTKKVAEAILKEMPEGTEIFDVLAVPADAKFNLIAMGYWADKGTADQGAMDFMKTITHTKVFSFFTLGAYPDSEHAVKCRENGNALYGEGCEIIGTFSCQGAIDPQLIKRFEQMPQDHPHAPNEERRKRWVDAAEHPNDTDFEAARTALRTALSELDERTASKSAAIKDKLNDPKAMPFVIAKELGVSEREVYAAMPDDMAVAAPISHFKYIWEQLTTWEKVTFLAMTPGIIIEVSCKVPAGKEGHGYFNLHDKSSPLGGHVRIKDLGYVYFVSRTFMGKESHSVQFFDHAGRHAFAFYVGRNEKRELLPEVKTSFLSMKTAFSTGDAHGNKS